MDIRVEADTKNALAALRELGRLTGGTGTQFFTVTLFSRIGAALLRWLDRNFASGGGEVGGWPPLRPLTVFGRRGGSSQPLMNTGALRQSFTFKATAADVRVGTYGSLARIARWQAEGTRPYEIFPRQKKALAFPAPPGWIAEGGAGFFARRLQTGRRGRAFPRAGGVPRVGLATATAIRAAGFGRKIPSGRGPLQSLAVVRSVKHPGLPARRIFPRADEIGPVVQAVIADFVGEEARKRQRRR